MDAIFKRVSIRKYQDRPVEDEKIEKILRAAMAAPSAVNQQPWEFYVVTDKDVIKKVSEAIGIDEGLSAFAIVALGYPAEEKEQKDRFDESRIHYIG